MASGRCDSIAMVLVGAQVLASLAAITLARNDEVLLSRATSWPGFLGGMLLMLGGIAGIQASSPVLGWVAFTVGAAVLSCQFSHLNPTSLRRSLCQASLLLLLAALLAPLFDYYSKTASALSGLSVGLLALLVINLLWPCSALDAVVSGLGAVLFAVWTVHDVATIPCENPFQKSVEVYLDVFNLFSFSQST